MPLMHAKLPIVSITPFTFQDYPGHTACILWFSGCNMRCGYCHNPELVKGEMKKLPFERVMTFLKSRSGMLDGAVLSGGECTLSPALPGLAAYLKSLDYKVKLDTNGTNPHMLERLLRENLVDFVALDFKAPEAKFPAITGFENYALFQRSLALLCRSHIDMEIRTTVHADLLDENDIDAITELLEEYHFSGTYVVQKFRPGNILANLEAPVRAFDPTMLAPRTFETCLRNF